MQVYHILPGKHTCLNKCAPTFEFTWPYLRNHWTILNQIFSSYCKLFMGSVCKFHWILTSWRACFLPSCPVRSFSDLSICSNHHSFKTTFWRIVRGVCHEAFCCMSVYIVPSVLPTWINEYHSIYRTSDPHFMQVLKVPCYLQCKGIFRIDKTTWNLQIKQDEQN